LTFQNHTNRPLTDFGGKTSIFSHPVYLFLRKFSLQDSRGGSEQIEIRKLRKKLQRIEMENEILKKATALLMS
ncbi:transposase, partial [Shigella flexneri]|uniref:transposase n=1 Tax=Shigella flexneri TaxID=623 RepID=UPI003F55934E